MLLEEAEKILNEYGYLISEDAGQVTIDEYYDFFEPIVGRKYGSEALLMRDMERTFSCSDVDIDEPGCASGLINISNNLEGNDAVVRVRFDDTDEFIEVTGFDVDWL